MSYGLIVEYMAEQEFRTRAADLATERRQIQQRELRLLEQPRPERRPRVKPMERLNGLLMQAGTMLARRPMMNGFV